MSKIKLAIADDNKDFCDILYVFDIVNITNIYFTYS